MKKLYSGLIAVAASLMINSVSAETLYETYNNEVFVVEDKSRNVICYVFDGYKAGGIDCIPKKDIESQEKEKKD